MVGIGSGILIGAGNFAIGFAAGWFVRARRKTATVEITSKSATELRAIMSILDDVESSATAQGRMWSMLRHALVYPEDTAELRPYIHSNDCYGQLLKSQASQLNLLDPGAQVVPDSFVKSLSANQRSIGILTEELRAENGSNEQLDSAKLLNRLETLESSNKVLCEELNNARQQVAQQSAELQETRSQAFEDHLTKLPNRRAFERRFEEANATFARHQTPFCLTLLDLDHFKQVNDTYGHDGGDAVLSVIARVLRETCRSSDFVARYGGEEFVVLSANSDLSGARILCDRIRSRVESTVIRHQGKMIRATCSIGLAQAAENCLGPRLIRVADELLYAAKETGRNRVCDLKADQIDARLTPNELAEIAR